jgi:hypothetical protein
MSVADSSAQGADFDFIDRIKYEDEVNEMHAALDPRIHAYMRNAHLLPAREEFATWRWYVRVLKLFERAPTKLPMHRFLPTIEQRWANAETLMNWKLRCDARRRERYRNSTYDPAAAQALRNEIELVATALDGELNTLLNIAGFNLGQLVAAGRLEFDVVARELTQAALDNLYPMARMRRERLPERAIEDGMRHPRYRKDD